MNNMQCTPWSSEMGVVSINIVLDNMDHGPGIQDILSAYPILSSDCSCCHMPFFLLCKYY